jgi:hypothetical protein
MRYAVVTLTVAGVIALGFLFQFDADAYLVMGVPITAAFQLLVSRRPLRALWVREAPPFRLDREGVAIAALLAVMPVVRIVRSVRADDWSGAVYGAVAIGGAVAAAYALRAMRRTTVRQLGLCIATAGVIGLGFNLLGALGEDLSGRTG